MTEGLDFFAADDLIDINFSCDCFAKWALAQSFPIYFGHPIIGTGGTEENQRQL
jgi:hypothetical protein